MNMCSRIFRWLYSEFPLKARLGNCKIAFDYFWFVFYIFFAKKLKNQERFYKMFEISSFFVEFDKFLLKFVFDYFLDQSKSFLVLIKSDRMSRH